MTVSAYHVGWFIQGDVSSDVTVRIENGQLADVIPGVIEDAIDLGPVALVDGLVNAHTHLEFSGLQAPLPPGARFTDWIRQVVAYRRGSGNDSASSIRAGMRESLESGTTLIGEIATDDWYRDSELRSGFRGVIFQEILGLSPDRVAMQQQLAQSVSSLSLGKIKIGLSPHAPYSTHWTLVEHAVRISQQTGCALAMHLAETREELRLLQENRGEFQEMLSGFGLWRDDLFSTRRRPLDYLKLLAQAPRSLVIHGNYLDDEELSFIADHPQMTLVYCPRTHAHFRHDEHPWRRARQRGVRVALGTDSRASNPDLSLFGELQFLAANNPEVSHLELLRIGSIEGRIALGFGSSSEANFTLIRLENSAQPDPAEQLFAPRSQVCGAMIDGEWVWVSPELQE